MKKIECIIALCILIVLISCEQKKGLTPQAPASVPINACDSIRFTKGIKTIIDKNCISCHSGPFGSGGVDLTTYANAKAFDARIKDRTTNSGNPMPPFGLLAQAKVDSILCWVNKGSPQ